MGYRILIVDDSPATRAFIRRAIGASGFPVEEFLEAGNGRAALEILARTPADAVLTDVNMPEMDGEELLRRMAANGALRAIPAIVISTDASAHRMENMTALGARGYVGKPFRPEELRAEIERAIGAPPPGEGFGPALKQSVEDALERMFFVSGMDSPAEGNRTASEIAARVDFSGSPSGWLTLRAGLAEARSLAADFLGEDEESVSDRQTGEVLGELANIVCGAVLTRTEGSRAFRLSAPRLLDAESAEPHAGARRGTVAEHIVALANGRLTARLETVN